MGGSCGGLSQRTDPGAEYCGVGRDGGMYMCTCMYSFSVLASAAQINALAPSINASSGKVGSKIYNRTP